MVDKEFDLICIPESGDHRYVLGKKGNPKINKGNLLIIALNPNAAAGNKHDSTTRNIERFAEQEKYDGWVLFNLSPVREPKPEDLILEQDELL
jgi:hypothetical protein